MRTAVCVVCWTVAVGGGAAVTWSAAQTKPARSYVVNDNFDRWRWTPITFSMQKAGRKALAEGKRLKYDYRGPLFRVPDGFQLPAGRMVEGADAYKGRSVLFEGQFLAGLHDRYGRVVKPGKAYAYSVALKGKGEFHFRAWMGGTDPFTGKFKWVGFPNLIAVKVTPKWKVYTGTFTTPSPDVRPYRLPERVSAAIVVAKGSTVYVDEFRVWEGDTASSGAVPSAGKTTR